jgi:Aspartyl protease
MKQAAAVLIALLVAQIPARPPVTIPFEVANHLVIVQAKVNNSRPLSFVLDTGANAAIVRMATAIELGLSLEGNVNTGGAGPGTQAGRRVKGASWSLVGLEGFRQPVSLALPFLDLPSAVGRDIDGIIGGEFIQQFVLSLDYHARTLTLHDPLTFSYAGSGQTLPIEFTSNRHPIVPATVTPLDGQPIEHRFMLDTGSAGALVLHTPFVTEHALIDPSHKTIRAIGAAGAGGRISARVGRVASLQIGSFTLRNPVTMFAEDTGGAFANSALAGNIGGRIANRFRIILDYGRRRIILEPSPAFNEPFDRAYSGLALGADGSDYRTFRVKEVLENSPATDAGIEVADAITAVDEIAASHFTLTAINELLERSATYDLTIRRQDRTVKVRLTTRPLVSDK